MMSWWKCSDSWIVCCDCWWDSEISLTSLLTFICWEFWDEVLLLSFSVILSVFSTSLAQFSWRNDLTTVDLKWMILSEPSSLTWQISFCISRSVWESVHFLLWSVLSSCHVRTFDSIDRLWRFETLESLCWLSAFWTSCLAWSLETFFMTFHMTVVCWLIVEAGGFSWLIFEYALKTRSVRTSSSEPAVSLTVFTVICNVNPWPCAVFARSDSCSIIMT